MTERKVYGGYWTREELETEEHWEVGKSEARLECIHELEKENAQLKAKNQSDHERLWIKLMDARGKSYKLKQHVENLEILIALQKKENAELKDAILSITDSSKPLETRLDDLFTIMNDMGIPSVADVASTQQKQ